VGFDDIPAKVCCHSGPGAVASFVPLYAALPPAYGSGFGDASVKAGADVGQGLDDIPLKAGGPVPLLLAELARRSQTMRRRSRQGMLPLRAGGCCSVRSSLRCLAPGLWQWVW